MIHDQALVDALEALPTRPFDGRLFRATRVSADPLAPTTTGGRWSLPPDHDPGVTVLYTSVDRDGAIAEVVSFLAEQTPIPGPRPIKVTELVVTCSRTLVLPREVLATLSVDFSRYGERDYVVTQRIGSAVAFLGIEALITPSARWNCDNFTIFTNNHSINETLDATVSEEIEWRAWAKKHGWRLD
jgi:hypothetical protein